jgi:hypothetical protein
MSRKNILGLVVAVFFALGCLIAVLDGPWLDGFHLFLLWIACGFWRYGEGLTDAYNRQQAFISGGLFGAMGFAGLQPLLKPIIDSERGFVVMFYFGVISLLFIRLGLYAWKQGTYMLLLTMQPRQVGKFFLFQPPEQVREHTRG